MPIDDAEESLIAGAAQTVQIFCALNGNPLIACSLVLVSVGPRGDVRTHRLLNVHGELKNHREEAQRVLATVAFELQEQADKARKQAGQALAPKSVSSQEFTREL